MKYLFLIIILYISRFIYSQATPQWLFPIWFEDANGDRDTVYIGYDPDAGISNTFDEEFEDYVWIDTTKFNVLVNRSSPSPYTGIYQSDSGKSTEVEVILGGEAFGPNIDFVKGKMPITMNWDMSLFYSNNLPYPDLSPYPNAVGFVYCGAGEPGYVNCPSAFDDDPLSMTDLVNAYYEYPITTPHVFEGSGLPPFDDPEEVLGSFSISIHPYQLPLSIEDFKTKMIIAPNPFNDYLKIVSNNIISTINLYDALGNKIKTIPAINTTYCTINTENLLKGMYYLEVETHNKIFTKIILKQ